MSFELKNNNIKMTYIILIILSDKCHLPYQSFIKFGIKKQFLFK